ncbi:MAG: tRNA guanosine(34) transglycosylase Tgt [Phycisphaerales bacterium]|nr:tRNA guanosine(34) transglycosylase Tgt [Phycisphaerales bacterium]
MSEAIGFTVHASCASTRGRLGTVQTPHGSFSTPAFMPVGTRATIKGLLPTQVRETGSEIILNNAYHLMLRPGDEAVRNRGGVHAFMRWEGPILTDSGGYQAWSMADINDLTEEGVTFKSIIDGSRIALSPERAIEVQNNLGPDIIMALDDCPPSTAGPSDHVEARRPKLARALRKQDHVGRLEAAVDRTARWLERCVLAHRRPHDQGLFGIVQGGGNSDLRKRSAEQVTQHDLPGYAIGGVAGGEDHSQIAETVELTTEFLPEDRPRYLMGVGYERDLVAAVRSGVDMFDCVLPTRNGRNAGAFTRHGRLQLRNARFKDDDGPIEAGCDCVACEGGFSRAYLRHLFQAGEMLGPQLVSLHNLRHFQRLMLDIRAAIRDDAWSVFARAWPVAELTTTPSGA